MKQSLVLFIMLGLSACGGPVSSEPIVTALMAHDLPELPGREAVMLQVEYGPGGADPVHRHDAHGLLYVIEGSVVMQVRGGEPQTLHAGQTFYEGPNDVHTVGRNASDTKPAKFVVVLIKSKGAPALIPEQQHAGDHLHTGK